MSHSLLNWLRVGHILGFSLWLAGLVATYFTLRSALVSVGDSRDRTVSFGRKAAMLADLGATLAMGCGFAIAFGTTPIAFKTGGWLHVKLTVVLLGVLSAHGLLRAKLGKLRRGQVSTVPDWVFPMLLIASAIIITLGAHPTLLRK